MKHIPKGRLYDKELIKLIEQLKKEKPGVNQEDLAISAGYYEYDQNGTIVALMNDFFDAVLNFKLNQANKENKTGAKPKYKLKVGKEETITIGKYYIREAGLRPGMTVRVTIMERGKIMLQPVIQREGKKNEQ